MIDTALAGTSPSGTTAPPLPADPDDPHSECRVNSGGTPEWLICTLPAIPASGEAAARIRRFVRNRAESRVTLGDQRPVGAGARVPAVLDASQGRLYVAGTVPELGDMRGVAQRSCTSTSSSRPPAHGPSPGVAQRSLTSSNVCSMIVACAHSARTPAVTAHLPPPPVAPNDSRPPAEGAASETRRYLGSGPGDRGRPRSRPRIGPLARAASAGTPLKNRPYDPDVGTPRIIRSCAETVTADCRHLASADSRGPDSCGQGSGPRPAIWRSSPLLAVAAQEARR
jgi:hypothetical protein